MNASMLLPLRWPPWVVTLRTGTGVTLFFAFIAYWHDFRLLYHPHDGLVHADLLSLLAEGPMPTIGQWLAFAERHTGIPIGALQVAIGIAYLVSCLLLAVAWRARPAAFALLFMHHSIYIAMPAFSYGMDYLAMTAIACCCFAPEAESHLGNRVALHTLRFVLCFVYFMGGYDKLGPSWLSGEAIWKALHLPGYTGPASAIVAYIPRTSLLLAIAGCATVLLEITYPVTIWSGRLRAWVLAGIVGMHLCIALFLGLYFFSAIMIALNTAAFIAPYRYSLRSAAHPIRSPFGDRRAITPAPVDKPPGPPLVT